MNHENIEVFRVMQFRATPENASAFDDAARSLLKDASSADGYLSSVVFPPEPGGDEFSIIMRFASDEQFHLWRSSDAGTLMRERLQALSNQPPSLRTLTGSEVWFPPLRTTALVPRRWRMTAVSWLGIYPTVAVCLLVLGPLLGSMPFLLRLAFITAVVAITMSYVVMPRLSKLFGAWIYRA